MDEVHECGRPIHIVFEVLLISRQNSKLIINKLPSTAPAEVDFRRRGIFGKREKFSLEYFLTYSVLDHKIHLLMLSSANIELPFTLRTISKCT